MKKRAHLAAALRRQCCCGGGALAAPPWAAVRSLRCPADCRAAARTPPGHAAPRASARTPVAAGGTKPAAVDKQARYSQLLSARSRQKIAACCHARSYITPSAAANKLLFFLQQPRLRGQSRPHLQRQGADPCARHDGLAPVGDHRLGAGGARIPAGRGRMANNRGLSLLERGEAKDLKRGRTAQRRHTMPSGGGIRWAALPFPPPRPSSGAARWRGR